VDACLATQPALQIGNAVAGILIDEHERYLLQRRDDLPQIWYPSHWGTFGGSVDRGEGELQALHRELHEELELKFTQARLFTRFEFDLQEQGLEKYFRSYYEIVLNATQSQQLVLHEGSDMRWFTANDALNLKLVPYDGFALLLHHQRKRLRA
jgi:8-oxo-dGTP pyrophosphatase MutT (NUDIX family)